MNNSQKNQTVHLAYPGFDVVWSHHNNHAPKASRKRPRSGQTSIAQACDDTHRQPSAKTGVSIVLPDVKITFTLNPLVNNSI